MVDRCKYALLLGFAALHKTDLRRQLRDHLAKHCFCCSIGVALDLVGCEQTLNVNNYGLDCIVSVGQTYLLLSG